MARWKSSGIVKYLNLRAEVTSVREGRVCLNKNCRVCERSQRSALDNLKYLKRRSCVCDEFTANWAGRTRRFTQRCDDLELMTHERRYWQDEDRIGPMVVS